jgi:2'-5' RNA ligase
MGRLRTFIAVELQKSIRDRLIALQEKLADAGTEVKWVAPENLHVTLLFLGEVEDREVPEVCRITANCAKQHAAFDMSIEGVGCFPNSRQPRIIWAGVGAGRPSLGAIHDDLEAALAVCGYRREDRHYSPHVTLGRIKSDRPVHGVSEVMAKHENWRAGESTVRELHVLSSCLSPRGPRYTTLSRAGLG